MTIGNLADATLALTRPAADMIGEGWSRQAFLINGVVYKVDMEDGSPNNWDEIHNIRQMGPFMPANVRLPETSIFEFTGGEAVIAMEYIAGIPTGECGSSYFPNEECTCPPGTCLSDEFLHPIRRLGIHDIGYGNLILSNDNVVYLIDVVS